MARTYDLVIRGGSVVDGTGSAERLADVALRGEKIADVGELEPTGETPVLDATGLKIAPGFIDAWAAADPLAAAFPGAESKLLMGVTTEVQGAGPHYPFPLGEGATESLDGLGPIEPDWKDARGFLFGISRAGTAINRAFFASYSQIRNFVMGPSDTRPTRDETLRISRELAASLAAGCVGLEVDLAEPPGAFASAEQVIELGRMLAEAGAVLALTLRDTGGGLESALDEALSVAERTGVEVVFPSMRISPAPYWGKIGWLTARMKEAVEDGVGLSVTVEPYVAWPARLASLLPPNVREGGPEVAAKRLQSPAARSEVLASLVARAEGDEGYWGRFRILRGPEPGGEETPRADVTEREDSLADIAAARNRPPAEVLLEILAAHPATEALFFELSEANVASILQWDFTAVGSSSPARPVGDPAAPPPVHPRETGTFVRVLRRYVRDKKVLALEGAVRRMTSLPAERLGLQGRGSIAPGKIADLVLFRMDAVADRSTFGNPAGLPVGIEHVIVAGRFAVRDGKVTGVRAGQVLRRG